MPQIQINGELREVSQAEYDALTTNGQASTPAAGSYEQYATTRAKEQAIDKLATGDAALGENTNISPEFRQELTNIRTSADSAAGSNRDAYAARYEQEQQDLYTNAPTSRAALAEELSAPPPTTAPGTVGVGVPQQQGTDGQVIGTLNTTIPGVGQPAGPIVSEPVKGLTAGGLTSGAPAAGIESAPTYPTDDPQIPPSSTADAGTFTPPPPPDAAFVQAQATKEERWQQAAATNPEGIQGDGSVKIAQPDGTVETINRDGSYNVSGADGTFYFNADGQQEAYKTPTVNGLSVTTTADGIQYTNYTQGPLTTSTITKDGEPISTTVRYDTGATTLSGTETVGGQPVYVTETALGDGEIDRTVVFGEDTTSEQIKLESKRVASEAELRAIAENEKLREDLVAAKQQVESGIPLSNTQIAALEEQAQATAAADAELAAAEQAVADTDPTVVPAGEDPQVAEPATQDPIPSLDTVQSQPADATTTADPEVSEYVATQESNEFVPVSEVETTPEAVTAADPEVAEFEAAQTPEAVPVAEVETDPTSVTDADPQLPTETTEPFVSELVGTNDDPQTPVAGTDTLPEALVYKAGEPPTQDPIVLAQADNIVTDVPVSDIEVEPPLVDQDFNPEVPAAPTVPEGGFYGEPPATSPQYASIYNPETGEYDVIDVATGQVADTGLSQEQAELAADTQNTIGDPAYPDLQDTEIPTSDLVREPTDQDVADIITEQQFTETDPGFFTLNEEVPPEIDPAAEEADATALEFEPAVSDIIVSPEDVDPNADFQAIEEEGGIVEFTQDGPVGRSASEAQRTAAQQQATLDRARQQAVLQQQRKQANDGDWRVKLRLAPGAQYLYRAPQPGILQPLAVTDGVVFPYTPSIQTAYKANYSSYDLTHSNYRGYFYQGSQIEDIQINAKFTAQDSNEANYLLAVIHFFRSITKMFYGNDPQRGAPPPLVFLQGLGEYQFNLAPCVVAQFNYNLPDNVDYIRAGSPNINGANLLQRRNRQDLPTNIFSSALGRIQSVLGAQGIRKGAIPAPPAPPTLGTNRPTYVPTAMDISIILHPIQSRSQVSKQFSLKQYASGDLLKGGFW